jgi:histidine triad (HIT) family protein
MPTIFERIIARELPATFVYEDDLCVAFQDLHPVADMHLLLVPKKAIPRLVDAKPEDQALLGHLLVKAGEIAAAQGYGEAFQVRIHNGAGAGQTVFHLHLHLLGGQQKRAETH